MSFYERHRNVALAAVALGGSTLLLTGLLGCTPVNSTAPKIAESTRLTLADIASSGGDVESARSILQAAAEQEPANTDVQMRYINALMDAGRPAEAASVAAKLIARHPQDSALALKIGQLQLQAKDPSGAAATFATAVGHGADSVAALNGLGVARVQQGDLASATETFRRAVAINPNDFASRNNLALALVLQGRSAEALPMLQSLANEPGSPGRVKHNLALAYAEQGNTREAAAVLTAVVGPTEALQEATSLAIVQKSSPASILSQLAPIELLGPNSAHPNATSSVEPGPVELRPVAPQSAVPQSAAQDAAAAQDQPRVAQAPRQGFSSSPLAAPQPPTATDGAVTSAPPVRPVSYLHPSGSLWHESKTQFAGKVRQATPQQAALQFTQFTDTSPEPPAPARSSGRVRVQIAAAPSEGAALALWHNLSDREPDLLADRKPVIRKRRGNTAAPWDLGTGGFQDAAAAEQFCRELRERGPDCAIGL